MKISSFHYNFLFLLSALSVFSNEIENLQKSKIDLINARIESYLIENEIPGFGLAVVQNGQNLLTSGHGFENVEMEMRADQDTLFNIGSVSKGFAALVCARVLAREFPKLGESVLDTPIVELAPDYDFVLSDRYRTESVNFRDLLSHRTCLNPSMSGLVVVSYENKSDYIYRQRYAKEVCQFRTGFVYNNHMVELAGDIIGHIAKKPYQTLVHELFADIGMNSTRVLLKDDDLSKIENLSQAYYKNTSGLIDNFDMELLRRIYLSPASGGVFSSASDMAKYLLLHLNLGQIDGKEIIPKDIMNWVRRASNFHEFSGYKSNNMPFAYGDFAVALGLFLGIHDGFEMISHGGYFAPFNGFLSFYPNSNFGIYTVSNGPGPNNHSVLHTEIYDIVQGIDTNNMTKPKNFFKFPRLNRKPTKDAQHFERSQKEKFWIEKEELVGDFGNAVEGNLKISYHTQNVGKELYLELGEWGHGFLIPLNETNLYNLDWNTSIVQDALASGMEYTTHIRFPDKNTIHFEFPQEAPVPYERDAFLNTFPSKPWHENSCGPSDKIEGGGPNKSSILSSFNILFYFAFLVLGAIQ